MKYFCKVSCHSPFLQCLSVCAKFGFNSSVGQLCEKNQHHTTGFESDRGQKQTGEELWILPKKCQGRNECWFSHCVFLLGRTSSYVSIFYFCVFAFNFHFFFVPWPGNIEIMALLRLNLTTPTLAFSRVSCKLLKLGIETIRYSLLYVLDF